MIKKLIVVVCNGNIQRSVVAELCLNKQLKISGYSDSVVCVSRGLQGSMGTNMPKGLNLYDYPMEMANSEIALNKLGINISKEQKSTPIDQDIIKQAGVVIAMDNLVLKELPNSLHNQFPDSKYKMVLFSELVDQTSNIDDLAGIDDSSKHSKLIFDIDRTSRLAIPKLISLLS